MTVSLRNSADGDFIGAHVTHLKPFAESFYYYVFFSRALYVILSFSCVCSRLVSVAGIVGTLSWSVLSWRESRIPSARCQPVEEEPLSLAAWLPTIGNGEESSVAGTS